jgi:exonuclease III
MAMSLRISAWNANGLKHHVQEIILLLDINKSDILLVSESLMTVHAFVKIPDSTCFC